MPIRPAPIFQLVDEDIPGRLIAADRVRIVRRTPTTGGPKGLALFTAVDGRKMCRYFRPGEWD